jgi:hypothetical protein
MQEIYDPHLKISKYQWGEPEATAHMKKMTPGENKNMGYNTLKIWEDRSNELEFDGIQTKHFHFCPLAYKAFKKNIDDIRAGNHLGEIPGTEPIHTTSSNTDKMNAVPEVGKSDFAKSSLKPRTLRMMQQKYYLGL